MHYNLAWLRNFFPNVRLWYFDATSRNFNYLRYLNYLVNHNCLAALRWARFSWFSARRYTACGCASRSCWAAAIISAAKETSVSNKAYT